MAVSDPEASRKARRGRYDKSWQERFVGLLRFIFDTYLLEPVDMEAGVPVEVGEGAAEAKRVVVKADTFSSWLRGHALPRNEHMAALAAYVDRNVPDGPHDVEAYRYVRDLLASADELSSYDRLERVSSGTGEFLSLSLELVRSKARGGIEYLPKPYYERKASGKTHAVVLDFAGTLTSDLKADSTWERIWSHLGLEVSEFWAIHDRYSSSDEHMAYLKELSAKFREKNLTREGVREAGQSCKLRTGVPEALEKFDEDGVRVYIVSRSERTFILGALGGSAAHVAEIHSNYFRYRPDGVVDEIVETGFDRKGKARFIERAALDLRISTRDILFVGNSSNDIFARSSGARTLCMCPYNTNGDDRSVWDDCIKSCDDFTEVLDYLDYGSTNADA